MRCKRAGRGVLNAPYVRRGRPVVAPPLLALATLLVAAGAGAQPLTVPRFDFSFSNPGARSMGFGGAFAALADDATASYANPAGLVQLVEPEASAEVRLVHRTPAFLAGGRAEGEPTGVGLDTRSGLFFDRDSSQGFGPSFAAVVLPKGRFTLALYGHRLADFELVAESQGFFLDEPFVDVGQPSRGVDRVPGSRERVDLEAVSAGVAAGWKANERLSFGLGVVCADVSVTTFSESFLVDDTSDSSLFGPITYRPERRISASALTVDDSDVTLTAGMLWQFTDRWSLGLFYRQGASVSGVVDTEVGPALPFNDLGAEDGFELDGSFRNPARFVVPNVFGAGLAYRSGGGRLTVATEVQQVGYQGLIRVLDSEGASVVDREYRDAWEFHLGAEVAVLRSAPILAFRVGGWVEANGDDLAGRNVTHLSAGLGIAADLVQVDLAADFSEAGDTASLSLIYTF